MRLTGGPMPTGSEFHTIANDYSPDRWVRRSAADPFPGFLDCTMHPQFMVSHHSWNELSAPDIQLRG